MCPGVLFGAPAATTGLSPRGGSIAGGAAVVLDELDADGAPLVAGDGAREVDGAVFRGTFVVEPDGSGLPVPFWDAGGAVAARPTAAAVSKRP